jgi:hypothetical protein
MTQFLIVFFSSFVGAVFGFFVGEYLKSKASPASTTDEPKPTMLFRPKKRKPVALDDTKLWEKEKER